MGDDEVLLKKCMVCGKECVRFFCEECYDMIRDYKRLKNYINSFEEVNNDTIYILDCAINERISKIINNVNIETNLVMSERGEFISIGTKFDGAKKYDNIISEIDELRKGKEIIRHMMEK